MPIPYNQINMRRVLVQLSLVFSSGFLNVVAMSTPQSLIVASYSGHSSKISFKISHGEDMDGLYSLCLIGCFALGASIAGMFNYTKEEEPNTRYLWMIALFCWGPIILAVFLAEYFEAYYGFLFLCSGSCGFLNAFVSIFFGPAYRTTHVTGTITDLSIILSRTLVNGPYVDTKKLFHLVQQFE